MEKYELLTFNPPYFEDELAERIAKKLSREDINQIVRHCRISECDASATELRQVRENTPLKKWIDVRIQQLEHRLRELKGETSEDPNAVNQKHDLGQGEANAVD